MIEYSRSYGKTFPTPILIGSGSTGLKCHLSNKAPRGKLKIIRINLFFNIYLI